MLYFGGGYPGVSFAPPAVPTPEVVRPVTREYVVEVPMLMRTGNTTRPVSIPRRVTQTMQVRPRLTLASMRGLAARAEIPMRLATRATLERG